MYFNASLCQHHAPCALTTLVILYTALPHEVSGTKPKVTRTKQRAHNKICKYSSCYLIVV